MTQLHAALFTLRAWIEARFDGDRERGATMVEYGLLVGIISIAAVSVLVLLGPAIQGVFQKALNAIPK
jgi:pilus assembly protein Flp/PilA